MFLSSLNQSQKIIIALVFFFLLGSIYLFAIDDRYLNPDYNTDWFALSFADPKSNDLAFTIENFTASDHFLWKIFNENAVIVEGDTTIHPQTKEDIVPETAQPLTGKITIQVSSDNETREVYKYLK
jgi:hypothetical protein